MKDPFNRVARGILHYFFHDGTSELLIGLLFYWLAWMVKPLPQPEMPVGAIILGFFLSISLTAWMKRRYVYPRSGFLGRERHTTPKIMADLILGILLGLVVLAPLPLSINNPEAGLSWLVLTLSLWLAGLFLFLAYRLRFWRFLLLALASSGLGILCSPLFLPNQTYVHSSPDIPYWVIPSFQIAFSAYFILIALALVVSGGVAFLRYLHSHPLPAETPDGQ